MREFLSIRVNTSGHDTEVGQSLVELSIGMILLLIMAMGLLDLGRMYYTYVALTDAAGEAALYLSVQPGCDYDGVDGEGHPTSDNGTAGDPCDPPNNAAWRAERAGGGLVDWSQAAIVVVEGPHPAGVGEIVRVTIEYPFQLLTPITPEFLGTDIITLHAEAVQTIITE